jgi:uncharacterized protein (DUF58 family)
MRRRRWLLAGLIAALLVALMLLGGYWAFVFYVVLLAAFVAWLMTYPALGHLQVERFCPRRQLQVGEAVPVRVRVRNAGWLPIGWVLVEDLVLPELPTSGARGELGWLGPGQEARLEYQVLCVRRGYYRLGPLFLEAGDYFGLLRRFLARPPLHYLTVYPRTVPIGRLLVPTTRPLAQVRARWGLLEDETRPAGVRAYRRGDPLRRIHWKATAHTGRLHSRVYEPARVQGAQLVLDFHAAAWGGGQAEEGRELAVTAAASLAAHLRARNQLFGLVSNGLDGARMVEAWPAELDVSSRAQAVEALGRRQPPERWEPVAVPPGRGEEVLQLVLGALARLQPGSGLTLEELIARYHPAWSRELAALLIVPGLRESLLGAVGLLRAAGFAVAVVVVGGELTGAAALADLAVAVYKVCDEESLASLVL